MADQSADRPGDLRLTSLPAQVSPPELSVTDLRPLEIAGADVIALPVLPGPPGPVLGPGADEVGTALGVDLLGVLDSARATGATGEVVTLPVADGPLVLLVGVGAGTRDDFRRAGAAVARATRGRSTVVATVPAVDPAAGLDAFAAGAVLGSFAFRLGAARADEAPVERVVIAAPGPEGVSAADVVRRAAAVARAGWRSRALAWVPANVKTPAWLAEQAVEVAGSSGLTVEVWDEDRLAAEGFAGLVGVGQASDNPPRLVRLDYRPAGRAGGRSSRRTKPVVLVGKGITFDSGGLSIKPGESMVSMKRDMTGGGVVLATMAALADVGCPVPVVGFIAAAENAVSGSSLRPGDVLRHWGGRTTEVTNTDAEGRLVMADVLAYAAAEVGPAAMVDVATLTGAIKVALGQQVGGLFATDDGLAAALAEAGARSGEPLWRMPLAGVYEDKISSRVADADNAGGGPGAITAALFLRHFVGDVPWAHLDIASAGDSPEDRHELAKGPTGFGARLLLEWLGADDPLAGIG